MSEALATQTTFDYDALEDEVRREVIADRNAIQKRLRRSAGDIVEIGKSLSRVKGRLPHGQFGLWLEAEFGWTDRTAQRFMRVAAVFKSDNLSDVPIPPSALYALASGDVPQDLRDHFLEQAERGEPVTHLQVQEAIKSQTEPRTVRVTVVPQEKVEPRRIRPFPVVSREPEPPTVVKVTRVDRNEEEEQPDPPLLSIVDLETGEVVDADDEDEWVSELAPLSYPDDGDTREVLEQMRVDIRRDMAWFERVDFGQLSPNIQSEVQRDLEWIRRQFLHIEEQVWVHPEDR